MFLTAFRDGDGCKSYIIACEETCSAAVIDPALEQADRYLGEVAWANGWVEPIHKALIPEAK